MLSRCQLVLAIRCCDQFASLDLGLIHVFRYSGKALFEKLGGEVPVGLLVGSVGGSPIESWLEPTAPAANNTVCGIDNPPCDIEHNITDSGFFNQFIKPLMPCEPPLPSFPAAPYR